jgi:ATP-dependent helicase/nuclease subunit A
MTLQQTFDFSAKPPSKARRNLVIEAGAGTGKTTAIVAEVLRLMMENETLVPERIVLMTFTEKAAGEIADRIRLALGELGGATSWPVGSPNPLLTIDDPERARPIIRRHLEQIAKLRSQTIHSFCQSLLRGFPIEAGLDPQFRIIEGFERTLLYGQLYDAWLDDETRVNPTPQRIAEWELLFTHVGYLFQIREVLFSMLERRDLLSAVSPTAFGDVSEVEDALLDAIAVVRKCAEDAGDEHARKIFAHVRHVDPPAGGTLEQWIEYFEPVGADILEANLPRQTVLKEALKVFRTGEKGRSIHERLVSHRAAMAILALTRRFIAFLDEEKRKLGVVDFDDLLLRTLAVLQDPEVLARARAQFDHIFVDEFQDTDRTQAQIIDLLARDASGEYVAGRTIVVGDPKQSIYGFRRADPETYYQTTQRLQRGGAERRVITAQYRSDAPLVDSINATFAHLFPTFEHDPNVFRPQYHALTAGKRGIVRELDARMTVLQFEEEDRGARYASEAEAIAEWIQARSEGDLRRFAILFRRMTILDDYLDVFDRRGIAYVLPPTRQFLDRKAPVDLLAVLRAIAYPFDRGAQISAARTPYFALTDDEITRGVLTEDAAWSAFTDSIAQFREAAQHLTVSALVDLVVETTNIESIYDAAADGVRHARHLEHVRGIAFEYERKMGGSVRQFVDEIARRREDPEEVEPSLIDEDQNAIRILTVHAAKGLEWDTVILPDLTFSTTNPDAMQLFAVEEPPCLVLSGRAQSISGNFRRAPNGEKLKKIATLREEAELRRLFYVAVTRAKTDVAFVCNTADTRNTGFFKCLCEVLGGTPSWVAERGRELRDTSIGTVAFENVTRTESPDRRRKRLADPALEAELAASPIVPCEIPTPAPVPTLTRNEIAARRAGSRNRAAGILLHRVLELWDGASPYEPLLQQLVSEAAADLDAVARVRSRLATIARSPTLARIAKAETVGREVAIRFAEADGAISERRIDRLIREDGRELVVDYKSGAPDPLRVEKDRAQVAQYCTAVAAMTGRACGGVLWYVDLERDEVVEI